MIKKDYLDKETKDMHDMMRKHFDPTNDSILVEFTEHLKSAGGIELPTPEKSLAHPVVGVGPKVEGIQVGDWISFKNITIDVFELFGRKWAFCSPYQIVALVNPTVHIRDGEHKKMVAEKAATKLAQLRNNDLNIVN